MRQTELHARYGGVGERSYLCRRDRLTFKWIGKASRLQEWDRARIGRQAGKGVTKASRLQSGVERQGDR